MESQPTAWINTQFSGFSPAVLSCEVLKVHGIIYVYLVATSKHFWFFLVFKVISKISYKTFNFGVQLNLTIYVLDCGFEFYFINT